MKFLATVTVAISSLAAVASANELQVTNPTQGTVWTAGEPVFVTWGRNCKGMGKDGRNVTVDIVTGPADALRYVATLGHINCSGSYKPAHFTLTDTIQTGTYALVIRTLPNPSYTNVFQINNPSI
ncbi:MAG: hypothetical protein J3Q66DRAFT_333206 [Benniella sp.]|nr:MAG: hypothetical protein J3Q66DRAFT_333206 [Benniella sp.]